MAQIVEEGLKMHRLAASAGERWRLIETALVEVGSTERAMTAPEHPYTPALMAAAFDLAAAS